MALVWAKWQKFSCQDFQNNAISSGPFNVEDFRFYKSDINVPFSFDGGIIME